ncbi:MAG: hydroxymethylbilane synthase [Pseudomonadota bacterium]
MPDNITNNISNNPNSVAELTDIASQLPDIIKIASRSSPLAMAQANEVRSHLLDIFQQANINKPVEILPIITKGDKILNVKLNAIGGKGLFTEELEEQLLSQEVHLAVHSMKDMPVTFDKAFTISAVLPRSDIRDVFISNKYQNIADMPANSLIGTSSTRRAALMKKYHPQCKIVNIRGNVNTRLKKLNDNEADAIILAAAGLSRLNLSDNITQYLPADQYIPAIGQGAIAIETLAGNVAMNQLLQYINDPTTFLLVNLERSLLAKMNGDCTTACGIYVNILENIKNNANKIAITPDSKIAITFFISNDQRDIIENYQTTFSESEQIIDDFAFKYQGFFDK